MTVDRPFTQLPEWVQFVTLSPQAYRLYGALALHLNVERAREGDTWVNPGQDVLADLCGFSTRQKVTRYARELAEHGLITVEAVRTRAGRRNQYRVRLDPPAGWAGPTSVQAFYAARREAEPVGGSAAEGTTPGEDEAAPVSGRGSAAEGTTSSGGGAAEGTTGGAAEGARTIRSGTTRSSGQDRTSVSDGRTARRAPVTGDPAEVDQDDAGRLADGEADVPDAPPEPVGSTPGQDEASADVEAAVAGRRSGRVRLHPPTEHECARPRREQQGIAMARLHKGLSAAGWLLLDRDAGFMPGADWQDRGGSELARVIGVSIDAHGLREAVAAAERWANRQIEHGSPWIVPLDEAAS